MPEFGIPVRLDFPLISGLPGSIVFNDGTYRLRDFQISRAVRSSVESIPQRHGSIMLPSWYSGAGIILQGTITETDLTARAEAMQDLSMRLASILQVDATLAWTPTGGVERQLPVRAIEDLQISGSGVLKDFQIALQTERTFANGATDYSADNSPIELGGTWTFPFTFPFTFGGTIPGGGAVTVTNNGDTAAYPIIQIFGPVDGPFLQHVETSEALYLPGLTIDEGNFVEIDPWRESITLNGNDAYSLIGYMDLASDFFTLLPGSNTIVLSSGESRSGETLRVKWRDGWAL